VQDAIRAFGVKEFTQVSTEAERAVEEIRLVGYTILTGVLADAELPSVRSKVDDIYEAQLAEVGGPERLATINDLHTARALLAYDEYFLRVATAPRVLAIVEKLLGDYFVLMLQNGIINVPDTGNEQNAGYWHRDLNYQHFISSRPLSISALFCVDEFSEATGGTYLLPASHKTEAFPSDEFIRKHEQVVNAPAGAVIVFDSMLYHRSGHNTSGRARRALNHMYTLPLIKQQISFPKILKGRFSDDPFLGKFLGYESESEESVVEFREKRLGRLAAS
jgi:ectoine hydroxylase-related dioxygenase (phytanoyl-CoA dioxygenase family)